MMRFLTILFFVPVICFSQGVIPPKQLGAAPAAGRWITSLPNGRGAWAIPPYKDNSDSVNRSSGYTTLYKHYLDSLILKVAIDGKEPAIPSGGANQVWAGDKTWKDAANIDATGAAVGKVVAWTSPNNYNLKSAANIDATNAAPGKVVTYRGPGDYYLTTPVGATFTYVQFTGYYGQTTYTNPVLNGKVFLLIREKEPQNNGPDFTISGSTITFTPALVANETILIQINP